MIGEGLFRKKIKGAWGFGPLPTVKSFLLEHSPMEVKRRLKKRVFLD